MGERVPRNLMGFWVFDIERMGHSRDLNGHMSDASQFLRRAFGSKRKNKILRLRASQRRWQRWKFRTSRWPWVSW